jgi:hypothetical protein
VGRYKPLLGSGSWGEWKFIAVILTAPLISLAAHAQDKGNTVTPKANGLARQDYVTSSGATVPQPDNLPKSYDETPLDRKIREQSHGIVNSICSAC